MNTKKLTVQYAMLQGCYWISFCAINSYATVFLLHIGLKSSQIGLVIALGNILGVILQPTFAAAADRAKKITLQQITAGLAIGIIALLIGMQCMTGFTVGITAIYLLINALLQVMQPLISSISMYYVNRGVYVDFGIGRGVGSAAFAMVSTGIGVLIERYHGLTIVVVGSIGLAALLFTVFQMPLMQEKKETEQKEGENQTEEKVQRKSAGGILPFILKYRNYMMVLIGLTLVYVEHTYVNTYLVHVVTDLGGSTTQLGMLMTVSAISELPTMALFSKLTHRWNSRQLMSFSTVMFTVKAIGYLLCGSVSLLYLVQMLQLGAFALCLPATVYYVNETMRPEDRVKGQSLIAATGTLGGVFGSLSGGVLIDTGGVQMMLRTGAVISLIGTIIVCVFVFRRDEREESV